MKMINQKKLIGVILSGIILVNLTGCKNQKDGIAESNQNSLSNTEVGANNNKQNELIENIETDDKNSVDVESKVDENANINKDEIIVNYFNAATDDINNLMNSENVTNAKAKCKEYFINFVDFIFYGGKIKNVTFTELKDETKKQVINIVQKVDTLIMKKFPDYKENIASTSGDLYNKASELLNSGKENLEDYIISKVGEDKYQEALDSIDEIKEKDKETWNDVKEFGSEVYESGKDKVKNWYENFKNN